MTLPRFLVPPASQAGMRVILTGAELHHLRVRRLRVGSELIVSDGLGRERMGIIEAIDRRGATIRILGDELAQRESPLHLVIAQALLKADKLDLVIEKATELGAAEVVVFSGQRSVARASSERAERWTRLARGAAKQSQRSVVPTIVGPLSFEQAIARRRGALGLFFWEEAAVRDLRQLEQPRPSAVMIMVGPEGGFAAAEAAVAEEAGFHVVGMAPRILRAETAAIVAVALCQYFWGDLGRRAE